MFLLKGFGETQGYSYELLKNSGGKVRIELPWGPNCLSRFFYSVQSSWKRQDIIDILRALLLRNNFVSTVTLSECPETHGKMVPLSKEEVLYRSKQLTMRAVVAIENHYQLWDKSVLTGEKFLVLPHESEGWGEIFEHAKFNGLVAIEERYWNSKIGLPLAYEKLGEFFAAFVKMSQESQKPPSLCCCRCR